MKLWRVFIKSMKEQLRDILTLSLTLVLAPGFVYLYWLFFPSGGSTMYDVAILSNDHPVQLEDGSSYSAVEELMTALSKVSYADGQPILRVHFVESRQEAEKQLIDKKVEVLLEIPPEFSQTMYSTQMGEDFMPVELTFIGDLTNPYYAIAGVMANAGLDNYIKLITREIQPVEVKEEPLGDSGGRTEFEIYVPGMLIFSIVILVFQASMVVAYECESGTLKRLKLSNVSEFELLGGISASILLIGAVSFLLAVATALLLGFTSYGSLWLAILIGLITCISVIGVGMIVAAFSKTVSQAFIIANFPLVFFMFFTGVAFPIRGIKLFSLFDHTISLYDILPPTHAVKAINKVLTLGAGFSDISFEFGALLLLSLVYFALGVWLFRKRHMQTW